MLISYIQNSTRVGKPYIKVNCAAIPESLLNLKCSVTKKGAFTGADKTEKWGFLRWQTMGLSFLDEIGDIPIHLQSKLLRVLQEKEVMRIGSEKTTVLRYQAD